MYICTTGAGSTGGATGVGSETEFNVTILGATAWKIDLDVVIDELAGTAVTINGSDIWI